MVSSYANAISQEVLVDLLGFFIGCIVGWFSRNLKANLKGKGSSVFYAVVVIVYILVLVICLVLALNSSNGLLTCPETSDAAEFKQMLHRQNMSLAMLAAFVGAAVGWKIRSFLLPTKEEELPKTNGSCPTITCAGIVQCIHICILLSFFIIFSSKAAQCTKRNTSD